VAKELGVSIRTLQRRITEEGTSFRQLVSDARRDLAKQYLLDPSLELAETACLLGYENPNSFFRAFREWEGTTPSEWRDARRGWSGFGRSMTDQPEEDHCVWTSAPLGVGRETTPFL
jgi:AraC-like DNA-binding protein